MKTYEAMDAGGNLIVTRSERVARRHMVRAVREPQRAAGCTPTVVAVERSGNYESRTPVARGKTVSI